MKLPETIKDFINILLGKSAEENQLSFKEELKNLKEEQKISDEDGILLMKSRELVDNNAKELDKKQKNSISLEDGRVVTVENSKEKKEKIEERKKEKADIQRKAVEHARISSEKNIKNQKAKLQIDREKILKEMEKSEKELQRDIKNEKSR